MNPGPLNLTVCLPANRQLETPQMGALLTAPLKIKVAADGATTSMKIGFNSVSAMKGVAVVGDADVICMLDIGTDRRRLKGLKAAVQVEIEKILLLAPLKFQWYITEYIE